MNIKMTTKFATMTALALFLSVPLASAETVHTKTYVQEKNMEKGEKINFAVFDLNKDGMYAKSEVGEKLFYIFDRDGNEVIDNLEWNNKSVYTIVPMEKETYKFVDYNDDGYTDLSSHTYETFYAESGLIHFDKDKDGLSASEFIDAGFQALDNNDSTTIELDEWQTAYIEMTKPKSAQQDRYN